MTQRDGMGRKVGGGVQDGELVYTRGKCKFCFYESIGRQLAQIKLVRIENYKPFL